MTVKVIVPVPFLSDSYVLVWVLSFWKYNERHCYNIHKINLSKLLTTITVVHV